MVHYNWPLSSCRWHTVSALNIISAFAYLRFFFFPFSVLSSRSFIPRLVSGFDIPKGNYHPRSSLSICHNGEWRCMSDCRFLFHCFQRTCRTASHGARENKSVFVWLYLTVLCSGVHCISLCRVFFALLLLLLPLSPLFAYMSLSLGRIIALNSSLQLLSSDPWQKERASRSICILRILMRCVLQTA